MAFNTKLVEDARAGVGKYDLWSDQFASGLANWNRHSRRHSFYALKYSELVDWGVATMS